MAWRPRRADAGTSDRELDPTRPHTEISPDNFRTNAFSPVYHGGQFGVRNRGWRGPQFNSHYTFTKAVDQLSDAFNADLRHGNFRPMNPYNIRLDRGRADFDIRHRFVTGFACEPELFRENRWLGGWVLTGIVQIQSVIPFNVFNHTNFGLPVGDISSADFGKSIFKVGTPRVIQLAIRYDF